MSNRHRARREDLGPAEPVPGVDLPGPAADVLRKLKHELGAFREDQRKVVNAGENLAKKNVDVITDAEARALRNLRATEEDWARALRDLHTDRSKVPAQDSSGPSLLGEVLAVLEEVELAGGRADRAAGLPREMQREIIDALDAGLPKGYEDLVKAYYEKLSQSE